MDADGEGVGESVAGGVAGEVVAVVPVRGLPAGKGRLAALFDAEQRNSLVRAMLEDAVNALRGAEALDRVVICSRDEAAREEARALDVGFLDQAEIAPGYNLAVAHAQRAFAEADTLLVVPADMPLLTPEAVDLLVGTAPAGEAVVVAPAHDGGTNGLLLRPPGVIRPAFGPSSAKAHAQAAADAGEAGVPFRAADIDVWAWDVDTPADLEELRGLVAHLPAEIAPRTRAWLDANPA